MNRNKENRTKQNELIIIGILLFISIIVRFYKLDEHSVWFDEYVLIGNVKYCDISNYLRILYINSPDYGISPASPIIFYYWINLFPEIDCLWRVLPIVSGLLTIILTYLFAKHIYDRKVAFLSSLFFCFSPFNIWFHQELKYYAFIQFFAFLSFFGLWKYFGSDGSNRKWFFIGFFSNLILPWFHAIYFLTPLLQIPILILSFRKSLLKKKLFWSAMTILSVLPWIIWCLKMSPFLFNTMEGDEEQMSFLKFFNRLFGNDSVGISEELLPAWKTNLVNLDNPITKIMINNITLLDYFISISSFILVIIFIINVLWKIRYRINKIKDGELFILISFLVTITPLFFLEMILRKPIFHPLYFFYIFPFLYIMISSICSKIKLKIITFSIMILLLFAFIGECFSFISFKNRTDYKSATKFIERNANINDVVLGERIVTFWDINKIYMKREDLQYQSFYSLIDVYGKIRRELEENNRNHIWIIIEPYTLSIVYQYDPIEKLSDCISNNGFNVIWRIFPGQYNLYVGYITKEQNNNKLYICDDLINKSNIDYEKLLKELNLTSNNERDNENNIYILKRYIPCWPIISWINIFTISGLIKDGHYHVADKLCDYLLNKYPRFGDIYLLRFIICYINERDSDCEYYLNTAYKQKKALKKIIYPILKNGNEVYNYYKKLNKFCLFPLGDSLVTFMNK